MSGDRLHEPQQPCPLDLHVCGECGHVQLLDVVDPDLLFANYTYRTSVSLGLVEHFRKYADDLVASTGADPGSLVVDIGSNDGTLRWSLPFQPARHNAMYTGRIHASVRQALATQLPAPRHPWVEVDRVIFYGYAASAARLGGRIDHIIGQGDERESTIRYWGATPGSHGTRR